MQLVYTMLARPTDIYVNKSMLRGDNIVKFWASNAYARVNNLLRHYDIDTLYKTTPYLFAFLQHFIHYFQKHGIYASKIAKKSAYLYRGIDDQYRPSELHIELGFIATSLDKAVSEKFANDGKSPGTLQVFAVSSLPKDVPFVLIDESIDSIFVESEILMLPGTVHVDKQNSKSDTYNIKRVVYQPDIAFVQNVVNKPAPILKKQRGGVATMYDLEHTLDDLCGKHIVFYRAIVGRTPEVLTVLPCPCDKKDVPLFVRNDVRRVSRFHDGIQRYIPEVQDLQNYMRNAKPSRATSIKSKKLMSYYPHMAIYDPTERKVVTLNGLMPQMMYEELVPQGRDEEITRAIHEHYSERSY